MLKRIYSYLSAVLLLFVLFFALHNYFLDAGELQYSLVNVYIFHLVSTLLIYGIVEFVLLKLSSQAGYAYLALIFLKIGFFVMIFQSSVFAEVELNILDRVSLIIPLFLFLITEAIAVSKLLNSK